MDQNKPAMILYYPGAMPPPNTAFFVRVSAMIQAFKAAGFDVHEVIGTIKQRRARINAIKQDVAKGKRYSFAYVEGPNFPHALMERFWRFVPNFDFPDYDFLSFCKRQGIPVGVFYRDVYWAFPGLYLSGLKEFLFFLGSLPFYLFDLWIYKAYVSVLYLPNMKMADLVPAFLKPKNVGALPPGMEDVKTPHARTADGVLRFFHVGGIGFTYDLMLFSAVIAATENTSFLLCAREKEWAAEKSKYEPFLGERVRVVHLAKNELSTPMQAADIGVCFYKPTKYRESSIPIKFFEYLAHGLPIVANEATHVAQLIRGWDVGWVLPYDFQALQALCESLKSAPEEIEKKRQNIRKILPSHTWRARALQVASDLGAMPALCPATAEFRPSPPDKKSSAG